jgi:hypothetical protein
VQRVYRGRALPTFAGLSARGQAQGQRGGSRGCSRYWLLRLRAGAARSHAQQPIDIWTECNMPTSSQHQRERSAREARESDLAGCCGPIWHCTCRTQPRVRWRPTPSEVATMLLQARSGGGRLRPPPAPPLGQTRARLARTTGFFPYIYVDSLGPQASFLSGMHVGGVRALLPGPTFHPLTPSVW